MDRTRMIGVVVGVALAVSWTSEDVGMVGQTQGVQVPIFEYDPTFPKAMPETWAIGPIGGMAVDRQDHLFVVQRPGILLPNERFAGADDKPPKADCCIPAPPVLEFDQSGALVNSWGGPGQGYDWPQSEHGVFVDHKDVVWLAGNGAKDHQILTFTKGGKFLRQFGKAGMSKGSADTSNMRGPANLAVDPMNNEVFVADGYGNRRVIVLDGETFAFKRMWGAYGNRPDDADLGPYNPDAPPAQQFRLPHNISISRDGFVYVADRPNNRIQVFRKDGTYVKEAFISRADAARRRRVRLCAVSRSRAAVSLHDRWRQPSRLDSEPQHARRDRAFRSAGSLGWIPQRAARDCRRQQGEHLRRGELRRATIPAFPLQRTRDAEAGDDPADNDRPLTARRAGST